MFERLTNNQLTELRAALWNHYDAEYTAYSEGLQKLKIGEETENFIKKWESRRDEIKEMQEEVEKEISKRVKAAVPAIRRR